MSYELPDDAYGKAAARVWKYADAQLKPFGDLALARLNVQPGERVLDIGCGAGQTCLQLGEAVGPTGAVLGIDLSPKLAQIARERATDLPQIRVVEGDVQSYAFPSVHAIYSRFGVMAFSDPITAFRNIRSALKPDGRMAFVCWRSLKENELDIWPLNMVRDHIPGAVLDNADAAPQFSFARRDDIDALLRETGFRDADIAPVDIPVSAGDVDDTLALCLTHGALGRVMRTHPALKPLVSPPLRTALEDKETDGSVWLNGAIWVVTASA